MKLVSFIVDGKASIGAVIGDSVLDLHLSSHDDAEALPSDMIAFLTLGEAALDRARTIIQKYDGGDQSLHVLPLDAIDLAAPIPRPPKIMMGGRNYMRHIEELRTLDETIPKPPFPRIFSKYHTAVVGPNTPVVYPKMTEMLDFEGEFTAVIGKYARNVDERDAHGYIAGYTIVNDVTARDIQEKAELILSKNFETFCPMGPWIVTSDDIPDPQNLTVKTYINEMLVAEGNTSEMIFSVAQYVSFLSSVFPLEPGDIISTGSPPGPGRYRNPPLLPKIGDNLRIEIEGIGTLENELTASPDA